MAKMKFDSLMKRVRGKLGGYVFRHQRGKMIISPAPDFTPRPPTAPQLAVREQFRQAAVYARTVLADPVQRVVYEQAAREKQQPVGALVIGDFLKPPIVDVIDLSAYHGHIGDKVTITAHDDIEVVSVKVLIRDMANQAVVEQGATVKTHGVWIYTATAALTPGQHVNFEVQAFDRPGHEGMQTRLYP